jgi:hypothetical protein
MNSPPPVHFPVECAWQWRGVVAGVWLLALMPLLAALALHAPARSYILVWLIVLAALIFGAWRVMRLGRGQPSGALVWNGAEWFLEQAEKDGAVLAITHPGIRLDGQRWLLLRARTGRRAIWLWIGRSTDPARWHALRCALYAQVSTPLAPA